ncbi:hypothetical protein QMZ20_21865, partial [Serratia bockelmannii]|nr:hypothetical protein [Serratia bockelmannii]
GLITRDDGPMVVRLSREPGKRESRYMHLFGGEVTEDATENLITADNEDLATRVAQLEARVAQLEKLLQQEH